MDFESGGKSTQRINGSFSIFRWISHAMLDMGTLFVYVSTFLSTSVLHHTGPEVMQHTGHENSLREGQNVDSVPMSNNACETYLKVLKH